MTNAVVGIEVAVAGFTLQLPLPESSEQVSLMVPVNPLEPVTLIGSLVLLLPSFTLGKDPVLAQNQGLRLKYAAPHQPGAWCDSHLSRRLVH